MKKTSRFNDKLAWTLAKRYYSTGISNPYIRFINRASRMGFALGVAALIIGLSLMNGFERELKNTLLSVIPDIEFEAVSGHLDNWPLTVKQIQAHPEVKAAAPYIKVNAMIQHKNDMEAVVLKGVSTTLEALVNQLPKHIVAGQWLGSSTEINTAAVIGAGLANKLKLQVGDSLELLIPKYSSQGQLLAPEYLSYKIVGIYKMGGQVDYGQVFVDLTGLQQAQGLKSTQAQGINTALVEPFNANKVASQIGRNVTDYVYVLDWFRTQGHVYNDIVMVKDIMYLVMVLVMSVASFNIVSSLSMSVQEKYSDIGILLTLGLSPSTIKNTFVTMGLLTAFKGIAWGVFWGCLVSLYLPEIMSGLESLLNFKALDGDVYFIDHLPSQLEASQVAVISLTAMAIAYFASLYPSRKAAKLTPIELLN